MAPSTKQDAPGQRSPSSLCPKQPRGRQAGSSVGVILAAFVVILDRVAVAIAGVLLQIDLGQDRSRDVRGQVPQTLDGGDRGILFRAFPLHDQKCRVDVERQDLCVSRP